MAGDGRRTKVERVIEEYDLEGWGDRLERSWLGEDGERASLRELATEFNVAVLEAALRRAGRSTIDADVRSAYRTLTDDDVPRADAVRKRRELEREGVDVDAVLADFVTHQAIHTYLTSVREVELDHERDDVADRKLETVQRLLGRTEAVTESTVEELVEAGEVSDRDYEVLVTVSVVCNDCGTDYTVEELIDAGGCDCTTR